MTELRDRIEFFLLNADLNGVHQGSVIIEYTIDNILKAVVEDLNYIHEMVHGGKPDLRSMVDLNKWISKNRIKIDEIQEWKNNQLVGEIEKNQEIKIDE